MSILMAIGINTSSLTIQRHLHNTQASMHTTMERLSSGKRINAANDDAAGLAISNKLTAVINGDGQAVRNANDAISLAQIAEGALEETTAILQRMRELSVQSGNGTNTSADRTALQSELSSLQAELNRISTTSTFNGQSLLDGSFTSVNFQIGHDSTNTVSLSISGMGSADLNKVVDVAAIATPAMSTLTFGTKAVPGDTTAATVGSATLSYDFVSGDFATAGSETVTEAATAYTTAWNASTDANVMAYTASSNAGVVTFTQDTATTGALATSVVNSSASAAVRSVIVAGDTGVVAVTAVPAKAIVNIDDMGDDGDTLQVTIGDASFTYTAVSGDTVRASALADSFVAAWNLSTDAEVSKFTASNAFAAMTFTQDTASTGPLTITSVVSGGIIAPPATASGLFRGHSHLHALSGVAAVTGVAATATQTFTVAAGANEIVETSVGSASFTYDFGGTAMASVTATAAAFVAAWNLSTDTNVMAYTASNTAGVVTYTQDTVSAGALTVSTVTPGVAGSDATYSSVNTLDISTTSGATSSITSLDLAIEAVSAERAKLGAFQNRLGHTVSNLFSMIENNSTARSRIQDADFAAEAALLAKYQVLQEAGTAMIALANTSSASVLSLLK